MARQCSNCSRAFLSTISRSHSHIATKRRQKVNLQIHRMDGERVLLCASCIKALGHRAKQQAKFKTKTKTV